MLDTSTGELQETAVRLSKNLETIQFLVSERYKYTSTITIAQSMPEGIEDLCLTVRAYHDAKCAEVVSFQGQYRFAARYDYPNPKMRTPDEKAQINKFLGELLVMCLTNGRPSAKPSASDNLTFAN